MSNFETTIIVEDPPYKFVKFNKQKQKNETYYLTANLFFNRNVWTVGTILNECKTWLAPHFGSIPRLNKMQLEMIFERNSTQFDLDNKGYFWEKVFFDIMKTPSKIQLNNSYLKGRDIISCNVLKDDTVVYVDSIKKSFIKGGNRIHFKITGELYEDQESLF